MNYNKLAKLAHSRAKDKGFWDTVNIPRALMLIICETTEAIEAHRRGRYAFADYVLMPTTKEFNARTFERCIKDTFGDELADTALRILDLCSYLGIDIEESAEHVRQFSNCSDPVEQLLNIVDMITGAYRGIDSPELVSDRLVCALLNVESLCVRMSIDLEWHIEQKMQYNLTRERMHGKAY